ncbi:polysaccharide deacetylase family protein [Nocardioides sp.]|uniref:polysaccharide deacetylase family protein n=1 Tax=Nocardioides sp. TaxID=35761 RepID=UPI00286EA3A3|nr:polysaccharide deacetylase family protein [Nocardioides sp.]
MPTVNICFHGIGTPRRELEPDEDGYWISRDLMLRVLDRVAERSDVRLSFDDGNASDAEIALPALQERGLTATFFVLAGRLDHPGSLTRDDVRRLHTSGMKIGSHGMWHRPWRGIDAATAEQELVAARAMLSDITRAPVQDAALPLGRYDRRLLARLRALDYSSVHTSDRRRARTDSWVQPRYSIRRSDTVNSVEGDVLRAPRLPARAKGALAGTLKRLR